MKTLFQVEIPRRQGCCAKGQEELLPGMEYYSLLFADENELMQRKDYCMACWAQVHLQELQQAGRTYWKAKVPKGKEERKLPLDRNERAFVLLKEAIHAEQHSEAFVLALYLAHQRFMTMRKERDQEGGRICLYEVLETEEMIAVKKMNLGQLEVDAIRKTIASKLTQVQQM